MKLQRPAFEFPPLGNTGVGEPVLPPDGDKLYWRHPDGWKYWVEYQCDRPAVAFRCHYPGGAAPCDRATADRFIAWATTEGG